MSHDWNMYRTRFLVRAKQLTQPVVFTDPLGREHRGKPGDYLVESSEGLLRVATREIFEDIYVVLENPCRPSLPPTHSVLRSDQRGLAVS
jgi:hypothetical protein